MFSIKKGAMFGLDARIALAIFGALSVISGAALYSAIQTAKAEQWRQYFVELNKASEQYYLDIGSPLPEGITSSGVKRSIRDLAENRENLADWKGPYISNVSTTGATYIRDNKTAEIHSTAHLDFYLRKSSAWTEMNDFATDGYCVINDGDCSEWLVLYAGNATASQTLLDLFNNLDNLIDGGDGALDGTVRFNSYSIGWLMFKGIPQKRRS